MDVAAWLQDLGLKRYVPAFRDNDIDAEVLRKLTAEDLISIGVTSVGHRRKLLDAIAGLGMAVPAAVMTGPAPDAPAQVDAERRQLTVMFCDLVGSTELSARLDPEDLRDIIAAYHRAVADVVGRSDGFVAKYMGDGVLVYFGPSRLPLPPFPRSGAIVAHDIDAFAPGYGMGPDDRMGDRRVAIYFRLSGRKGPLAPSKVKHRAAPVEVLPHALPRHSTPRRCWRILCPQAPNQTAWGSPMHKASSARRP
jgi:hypothetical protein